MLCSQPFSKLILLGAILTTLGLLSAIAGDLDVPRVKSAQAGLQMLKADVTPTPTCVRAWEVVPGANVDPYDNSLNAVSAVSASDIWAVGYYMNTGTRVTFQLIIHWDGNQWSVVNSPSPISNSTLNAVVAISSNDAWAVGAILGSTYRSFFIHWDGQQWSLMPNPAFDSYVLAELTAGANNDVWVVGHISNSGPQLTVAGHWDGQAWNVVASPNMGESSALSGATAISADDVWAVGGYSSSGIVHPLTMHWNGQEWSLVSSPSMGTYSNLAAVAAVTPDDVWAVGEYRGNAGAPLQTFTMHWDGIQWEIVPSPNVDQVANELFAVATIGTNDVWAVGLYSSSNLRTLTLHWDGNTWSTVTSPNPASGSNLLRRVAADPIANVWAIGGYSALPAARTLVIRYPGSCPDDTPTPTNTGTPPTATRTYTPSITPTYTLTRTPTPCRPPYNYVIATGAATIVPGSTDIGNHCDECFTTITLPFAYTLYDQTFTSVRVESKGDLRFVGGTPWEIQCVSGVTLDYALFPYWADLLTEQVGSCTSYPSGCGIFTSTTGIAPNRIFNIEWRTVYYNNTNQRANFEVRLYEGQTRFDVIYGTVEQGNNVAIAGVKKDNTAHVDYFCWGSGNPAVGSVAYTLANLCPSPTIVPTSTDTPTATPTATSTALPSGTSTPTATRPQPSVTATSTSTPTFIATSTPTPTCTITFSDVHPTDYFYQAVLYLYCHGIISGYADGTFRPYNNTTRGQLTKIIVLAEGWTLDCTTQHFLDVPPSHTFYCYIETAVAHGVISGYADGTFKPGNDVTRGQLCKIVVLAEGWADDCPMPGHFSDVPPSHTFYCYIETAYNHGIISGYADGTFRPGNPATRGQICKIVYQAITQP